MIYQVDILETPRHEQRPGGGSRYVHADITQNGRKVGEVEGTIDFEPTGEPRSAIDVFQGMRSITVFIASAYQGNRSTGRFPTIQEAVVAAQTEGIFKLSPYHEQPVINAECITPYMSNHGTGRQSISYQLRGGEVLTVGSTYQERDVVADATRIFGRAVRAMPIAQEQGQGQKWAIFKGWAGSYPEGGANNPLAICSPGLLQFTEYGHQYRQQ